MANISQVYLLDTPLEDDLKHTLYFANKTAQHNYMASNIIKTYTNVSYQRDTSTFRCPAHIDSIRTCNYMMYQNSAYSNKWFYCFIEKMTYVNDNMTDVEFKVDPIQTFMFDFDTQPSFIEREHTNNDTVGNNTVPENLELGEYVNELKDVTNAFEYHPGNCAIAMGVTKQVAPFNDTPVVLSSSPDALTYIGFDYVGDFKKAVKKFNDEGHGDYINCVFICPKACFSNWISLHGDIQAKYSVNFQPKFEDTISITKDNLLGNGYSPRNKKLLTYPFRYLQLSNQNGAFANYHYEDFYSSNISFAIQGTACPGCDAKVYPRSYKQILYNYDEGISLGKLPVGSWESDAYTNWLTQNGINLAVGFAGDIFNVGVGLATAPAGGGLGVVSGISGITSKIGQIYQHSMQPPQAEGATNVGNAGWNWGWSGVKFKYMTIKAEYARIADDFFDMFGYATHRVKKPNYAHRQNWWYTKTIDVYIKGNIPNEYMNEIKNAYNNGITYWRNPSNFMNYSVSNGIV